MTKWFEDFHQMLQGKDALASLKLRPAGTASMSEMLEHVRYQFSSKTREGVEETFPKLLAAMSVERWESVWGSFVTSGPRSPRSLDEYPQEFLTFFLKSDAPHGLKELARFEWALEIHPWGHTRLLPVSLPALAMSEELAFELPELDIQSFEAPVMQLYQGAEVLDDRAHQQVLIWYATDGMRFHELAAWEPAVLRSLHKGLGEALAHAPDNAQQVNEFFQWLGQSGLVRGLRTTA